MTSNENKNGLISASEIREIVGDLDDTVIAGIAVLGVTREEVLEAQAWLCSDDYLHRVLHRMPRGLAAQVVEILEASLPEPDRP